MGLSIRISSLSGAKDYSHSERQWPFVFLIVSYSISAVDTLSPSDSGRKRRHDDTEENRKKFSGDDSSKPEPEVRQPPGSVNGLSAQGETNIM